MKNTARLTYLIVLLLLLSCKQNQENLLPGTIGDANDLVVVMSGPKWESSPGEIIRKYISDWVPGLPQEEPNYDYLFVPHANFDKVYKRQRNILVTKIGPDFTEKVLVQRDTWAKSQLVITVMAPNSKAFIKLYDQKGEEINELIKSAEFDRLINSYKKSTEKSITRQLVKNHDLYLTIPKGYKINIDTSDFVWLRNEYRDIIEGIFIYHYPYTDKNTFSTKYLIEKRNSYLKKYTLGEVEGSYMSTESRFDFESREFNMEEGGYTKEIRGLWRMEKGLAMGGPFISISQYDEKRKRIVTIEGFIFAPAHKKRNLMHKIEAIIYSLNYDNEDIQLSE